MRRSTGAGVILNDKTFWGPSGNLVTLTAGLQDLTCGSVTVPSFLPARATIKRVETILKIRKVVDDSGAINYVNSAINVQVEKHVGGAWTTGLVILVNQLHCPATSETGGDVLPGTTDVKAEVTADNLQYDFRLGNAKAFAANLYLYDIQPGLKFFF